jgi:GT2 family glycosyltransferase
MKQTLLRLLDKDYTYPKTKKKLLKYARKYRVNFEYNAQIDIVMPTFNRLRETRRCIENLYKTTTVKFRLIIIDNNSSSETREYLKKFSNEHNNVELILLSENLGGAGSRIKALELVKSEFVAFLDNDIYIMPGYLENLIKAINDSNLVGVQSKVVQPNGLIQINRPYYKIEDGWIIFYDKDIEKFFYDKSAEFQQEVDWIPAGATIWRTEIFKSYQFDKDMGTSYEDNDLSYRLRKAGFLFSNCPSALCIHYSSNFAPDKTESYQKERFSSDKVLNSARIFHKKHNLYFSYGDPKEYVKYISLESIEKYLSSI